MLETEKVLISLIVASSALFQAKFRSSRIKSSGPLCDIDIYEKCFEKSAIVGIPLFLRSIALSQVFLSVVTLTSAETNIHVC